KSRSLLISGSKVRFLVRPPSKITDLACGKNEMAGPVCKPESAVHEARLMAFLKIAAPIAIVAAWLTLLSRPQGALSTYQVGCCASAFSERRRMRRLRSHRRAKSCRHLPRRAR